MTVRSVSAIPRDTSRRPAAPGVTLRRRPATTTGARRPCSRPTTLPLDPATARVIRVPVAGGSVAVSPSALTATVTETVLEEGFEGAFPGPWLLRKGSAEAVNCLLALWDETAPLSVAHGIGYQAAPSGRPLDFPAIQG